MFDSWLSSYATGRDKDPKKKPERSSFTFIEGILYRKEKQRDRDPSSTSIITLVWLQGTPSFWGLDFPVYSEWSIVRTEQGVSHNSYGYLLALRISQNELERAVMA